MEESQKTVDKPFVTYGLAEVHYNIEISSKYDEDTGKKIISLTRAILDNFNNDCALNLKVCWKLSC